MWIKICGMTSAAAVEAAVAAGADAIGFVFSPSVRQIDPGQARRLARPARARARCVAVTLHPTQALIEEILAGFGPDALQADLGDFQGLRLPASLERLPVVRGAVTAPALLPPRILFDAARSGSGMLGDWEQASALAGARELVLAGGLDPDNVGAAIAAVRPFGVDVSSGVESRPGEKSPDRIEQFARAARAAFHETDHELHRHTR